MTARRCRSPRGSRRRGQPLKKAAGGAALVGSGCPPARVSLYPPGAWSPGGIHHKYLQDIEKK